MDHPEGCLIIVFFNTGDNLGACAVGRFATGRITRDAAPLRIPQAKKEKSASLSGYRAAAFDNAVVCSEKSRFTNCSNSNVPVNFNRPKEERRIAMRKFPVETSTPTTVRGIGLFIAPPVQLQGQGPIA